MQPVLTSRITAVALLFSGLCSFSIGYSVRNAELPVIRLAVLPADKPTGEETVLHKPSNSELIVGEDGDIPLNSLIKLECEASYPVQYIYSGDGMPEYSTNTSQSVNRETAGGSVTKPRVLFEAQLFLGFSRKLGSFDTGKYTCRSLQDPTKSVHYYIFVTDGKLFIRQDGDMIYFKRSDTTVRIPCSVTDPKAVVSLQKSVNGLVQCPLNDSISYLPTAGFQLKTSNSRFDPAGTYVCTAGRNGVYQAIQYELVAEGTSSNITPQPEQIRQCNRDVDCPSNESCRSGSCTSPCTNSCGQNTSCRVVNHLANCQCLSGYTGDPYVGCSMSSSPSTSEPSQQKPSDPCQPFPCGTNTVCENHRGIAKCSCAPGYQGDPYYRCYRRNDPCNPNPCGSNSVCINRNNYASCSCAQGFIGTPPHCRAECEVDQHCSYNQVCHRYRCRDPCEGACNDIPNTQCRVINRRPVCARYQTKCPSGFYGRDCSTLYERDTNKAPSKVVDDEFLSPCVPFVCGSNAECTTRPVFDHGLNQSAEVAYCQCPPGKTGNADMECYPVEEQKPYKRVVVTHEDVRHDLGSSEDLGVTENIVETSTTSTTTSTSTTTTEAASSLTESSKAIKNCGTNAISILSADGKSICSCPVGYTGLASIECHALMMDDEPEQQTNSSSGDIGNEIIEPEYCDGTNTSISCGNNAYCVISNGSETCMCMRPFKGNPEIGCELECSSDSDCPSEYSCYKSSGRCVDPCEPGLQMFFKSCGRDAFCKAEDHKPVCYCPKDLPNGDPEIHCKEKSWMPNHLPPTPLKTCDKKENTCGKNAECRMFHDSKTYCVCMPGYFGDPYDVKGPGCEQGIQCRNSTHCASSKECVNGRCLDPCRPHKILCGEYAGCSAGENHQPKCICNIGTIRNPDGSCEPVKGALAERMAFFRSFEDF